jgi:hypothetical protein
MRRLYWLMMIFVGFTLPGCALVSGSSPQPAAKITPATPEQPTPPPKSQPQATKKETKTTPATYSYNKKKKPNNPMAVQVYPQGTRLTHPYTILAHESVSKFNAGGIKRQEANIHDTLRDLAASIGGDAVINVKHDSKEVTGTIVSFEGGNLG